MIQQINPIPVPQQTQAQSSQLKEATGGFQVLLKKTIGELNSKITKRTNPPNSETKDDKTEDQLSNLPVIPTVADTSALAAILQPVNDQMQVPHSQTVTSEPQLPVLQAAEATRRITAVSTDQQQVGLMPEAAISATQPGNISSVVQQTSSPMVKYSSDQQQVINTTFPNLVQSDMKEFVGENSVLPVPVQVKTVQASPQDISPVQQSLTQAAAPTKQPIDFEPIASTDQANVQLIKSTAIPTVIPTEQTVGSDFGFVSAAQAQAVLPAGEKTKIPVQAAVNQNQNSTRFTDLFQNGNVVIKVSDASSNSVKPAVRQITDQIAFNYKTGNSQFQMELHPQDLGKVSVKLSMQGGLLTIEIAAANPKTQSMLMASSDQIKTALQSTVSQPVRVLEPAPDKLWYQQQDQPNQSQQQQQEKQQHRNVSSYLNSLGSDVTTGDFLTVMQQLREQAYFA